MLAPFLISMQDHFGVRSRVESVAFALQFFPDFFVVIDFAVERDAERSVARFHGLVSEFGHIENRQSPASQSHHRPCYRRPPFCVVNDFRALLSVRVGKAESARPAIAHQLRHRNQRLRFESFGGDAPKDALPALRRAVEDAGRDPGNRLGILRIDKKRAARGAQYSAPERKIGRDQRQRCTHIFEDLLRHRF